MWIAGGDQQRQAEAGSDAAVNLDGYVSVTPMRADLTDHDALSSLSGINA
jgi:5'-nucleotidase